MTMQQGRFHRSAMLFCHGPWTDQIVRNGRCQQAPRRLPVVRDATGTKYPKRKVWLVDGATFGFFKALANNSPTPDHSK